MAAPTQAGADIQQAARHLAEGQPAAAIAVLERLTEAFPAYVTAHVLLAKAYETAGRLPDALSAWHRAYFLMPGSPLVARQRARLLQRVVPEASEVESPEPAEPEPAEPAEPAPLAEAGAGEAVWDEAQAEAGEPATEESAVTEPEAAAEAAEPEAGVAEPEHEEIEAVEPAAAEPEVVEPEAPEQQAAAYADAFDREDETARAWEEPPEAAREPEVAREPEAAAPSAQDDTEVAEVLPPRSEHEGANRPRAAEPRAEAEDEEGWRLLEERFEPEPLTGSPAEGIVQPPRTPERPATDDDRQTEADDHDLAGEPVELAWDEDVEELDAAPETAPSEPAPSEGMWVDDVELDAGVEPEQERRADSEAGGYLSTDELLPATEAFDYDEGEVGDFDPSEFEHFGFEEEAPAEGVGEDAAKTPPPADLFSGVEDLDALIEQLENAPRIRPAEEQDPDDEPEGDFGAGEVVSETLARIYETQQQYGAAARAYATLAAQHPERAEEFETRAAEMRRRAAG